MRMKYDRKYKIGARTRVTPEQEKRYKAWEARQARSHDGKHHHDHKKAAA